MVGSMQQPIGGCVAYIAPELISPTFKAMQDLSMDDEPTNFQKPLKTRGSDIYALGITCYEVSTPFIQYDINTVDHETKLLDFCK
jgi:serine/threonine protein kinase